MARRFAWAVWWAGVPVVFLAVLLAPRMSTIHVSFDPFSIEANTLQTSLHPILDELAAGYRCTAVALGLLIIAAALSHYRRAAAVRSLSLALPVYVAAFEACIHFEWFSRRHHYSLEAIDLQHEFYMAAIASLAAVTAAIAVAAIVVHSFHEGVAERNSRLTARASIAVLTSVALLWLATDQIFFRGI